MSFTTDQRFRALGALIQAAKNQSDPQTASYLCRLACVQICGNLERCIELLIRERFEKRTPPQIDEFLSRYFKRGTNFDCEEICALLNRFDREWGRTIGDFIENNQQVRESINGCYGLRNAIAHGGAPGLGYAMLQQYFDVSQRMVAKIEAAIRS